jgi:hypothetical protein
MTKREGMEKLSKEIILIQEALTLKGLRGSIVKEKDTKMTK